MIPEEGLTARRDCDCALMDSQARCLKEQSLYAEIVPQSVDSVLNRLPCASNTAGEKEGSGEGFVERLANLSGALMGAPPALHPH